MIHGSEPKVAATMPIESHAAHANPRHLTRSIMITEYVLFSLPEGISREEVVAGMHEVAPRWRSEADLIRKTFLYDAIANQTGAFYLWKNRASAEAAHGEAWRRGIRAKYGSEPKIMYFETPLIVDNALGRIIADEE